MNIIDRIFAHIAVSHVEGFARGARVTMPDKPRDMGAVETTTRVVAWALVSQLIATLNVVNPLKAVENMTATPEELEEKVDKLTKKWG